MARMEMDVDLVEQTGRDLKRVGESVSTLVASIERTVHGLAAVWEGQDARRFIAEWWPQHKAALLAAGENVAGLGRSVLYNASEQREASGEGGLAGGAPGGSGGEAPPAITPDASRPGGAVGVGANEGALPPGEGRGGYVADMGSPPYPNRGTVDGLGAFKGECTSWAAWRRQELGLEWRQSDALGTGNGGEMAGRMGGSSSNPPSLGAIVSDTGEGHVMIIEEVRADGSFRVSEMNIGGVPGSVRTDRIWTPNTDGTFSGHPWGGPTRLVIAP